MTTYALRYTERVQREISLTAAWIIDRMQEEGATDDEIAARVLAWNAGLKSEIAALSTFPGAHQRIQVSRRPALFFRRLLYRHGKGSIGHHVYYDVEEESPDGPRVRILHLRPANLPLPPAEARALVSSP